MTALRIALLATAAALLGTAASAGDTPAPAGSQVYLVEPKDGAVVKSPFRVMFGLVGMGVAPALVEWPNTGHHHLLIDSPPADPNKPIPNNAQHLHFGGGQTEAMVTLPPGRHTLQAVLGDHNHIPHAPVVQSPPITITVE